jgi:hypothetical protein
MCNLSSIPYFLPVKLALPRVSTEIPISNKYNFFFTYLSEKCFEISALILKSVTEIVIQMSALKFPFRHKNHNRISDVEIERKISTKLKGNFVGISISPKENNRNRIQNSDFGIEIEIAENRNIEIPTKLGQNFVESKKMTFMETLYLPIVSPCYLMVCDIGLLAFLHVLH